MCPRVDGGGFAPSKSFSLSVCRSLYSSMGVCMIMLPEWLRRYLVIMKPLICHKVDSKCQQISRKETSSRSFRLSLSLLSGIHLVS